MTEEREGNKSTGFTILALVFVAFYIVALISPDAWWGFHYLAFLPWVFKYGILVLALTVIIYFHFKPFELSLVDRFPAWGKWLLILLLPEVVGHFYFQYPMYKSFYGDAEKFGQEMGERTTEYNEKFVRYLLTPNVFSAKTGNTTVLSGVRLMSYYWSMSHQEAYRILGAMFGMLFILVWLVFVSGYFEDVRLKFLFGLLGITAPFTQFFFGYEEIYAPAFALIAVYMTALLSYFKWRKAWLAWSLLPLCFLCIKFHSACYVLLPSLGLTLAYHVFCQAIWFNKLFTWKYVFLGLVLPIILGGAYVYFFVLQDHVNDRFVGDEVNIYHRLFLPIFKPEPPYDRYTLLSFYHFFDVFNLLFIWSGGALFIIIGLVLFYRRHLNWVAPELIIVGVTLGLYLLLFFMINPLMSMPIDCDYFSLPGVVLLAFSAALVGQIRSVHFPSSIAGGLIALSLLSLPVFMANASGTALSHRMERLGVYVFKSYWIRSAGDITNGTELETDTQKYIQRYLAVEKELEPYALERNDTEYANILWRIGRYYRKEVKDYQMALKYHQKAYLYDSKMGANLIGITETYYLMGRFVEANEYARKLIALEYPSKKRALEIAMDCAVQGQVLDDALIYADAYIEQWPNENTEALRESIITELEKLKTSSPSR